MTGNQIFSPYQKFFNIESLGGVLLFCATLLALVWANSPWGHLYTVLWEYQLGFRSEGFELYKTLILWINDGLMAIFFFVIGLEIKRELLIGELHSVRKAMLPLIAAIGGMIVPVILFLMINQDPAARVGWGIPMATDIAFSLAILRLLGDRVPIGLKIFLTAFAIVDDLGAVFIIAVFYSGDIRWELILVALVLLGILYFLAFRKIYAKYCIFGMGMIIWILFLKSGVHPTIAGILLAFAVPVRQRIHVGSFADQLVTISQDLNAMSRSIHPVLTKEQIARLDDLEDWMSRVQSPLQHLEHRLHGWVAYFILPVFALANAGIEFEAGPETDLMLAAVIAVSLVAGKSLGIPLLTWLGLRLRIARLPEGVTFRHVIGAGLLAGIGFTMAIFIANLAFAARPEFMNSAKIGILTASFIAAVAGYLLLRGFATSPPAPAQKGMS